MKTINRRNFLAQLSGSLAGAALPLTQLSTTLVAANGKGCWLSVCVPLIIEDPSLNLHTDIILTSATFDGVQGYRENLHATDYELYLYDPAGKPAARQNPVKLSVPAMQTTVVNCRDLLTGRDAFWGGLTIKMRSRGNRPMFVSDLFSAAFARWNAGESFDTLHAHPDPLQFQTADKYFSSMPFPSLEEHACTLSLFNPYATASRGRILLYADNGEARIEKAYDLPAFGTALFNLNGDAQPTQAKNLTRLVKATRHEIKQGGALTIENDKATVKNFAYLLIKGKSANALAAEHTIHQTNYPVARGAAPFGEGQSFKPRGWVYSAFVFNQAKLAGLSLSSRVYLSAGRPLEDELWMLAYASDSEGNLQWTTRSDKDLGAQLAPGLLTQGTIKLKPFQSCRLDVEKLSLAKPFAGGIGIAVSPQTSHVLNKTEVRVLNWNTGAFTHFRPGARGARALQKIAWRGGLASDYLITGANATPGVNDSLLAVFNIDEDKSGQPTLEVFNSTGIIAQKQLTSLPGLACRYVLLSDLFPQLRGQRAPFTVRLMDERAVVILSALHIDYQRKDIAIDHGSDRFSTMLDYTC
ncbi:MAG: hypothetical protein AB1757_20590 [Acidobacteriota bacterium]